MDNVVVVKGSAYEQGLSQGKALAPVIKTNIDNVKLKLNPITWTWKDIRPL